MQCIADPVKCAALNYLTHVGGLTREGGRSQMAGLVDDLLPHEVSQIHVALLSFHFLLYELGRGGYTVYLYHIKK